MKLLLTLAMIVFCSSLYAQREWKTVFENKKNSQMEEQVDMKSIVYQDGYIYFSNKTIYKELTRKQFILQVSPALKSKGADLKGFSYTITDQMYSPISDRYRFLTISYYDENNKLLYKENIEVGEWFKYDKGSVFEKVINAVIDSLDL